MIRILVATSSALALSGCLDNETVTKAVATTDTAVTVGCGLLGGVAAVSAVCGFYGAFKSGIASAPLTPEDDAKLREYCVEISDQSGKEAWQTVCGRFNIALK